MKIEGKIGLTPNSNLEGKENSERELEENLGKIPKHSYFHSTPTILKPERLYLTYIGKEIT